MSFSRNLQLKFFLLPCFLVLQQPLTFKFILIFGKKIAYDCYMVSSSNCLSTGLPCVGIHNIKSAFTKWTPTSFTTTTTYFFESYVYIISTSLYCLFLLCKTNNIILLWFGTEHTATEGFLRKKVFWKIRFLKSSQENPSSKSFINSCEGVRF